MVLCYQLVKEIYTIFLGNDFSHFLFDLHTISITIRDENCKYNNTNYIVHLFFLHHQNFDVKCNLRAKAKAVKERKAIISAERCVIYMLLNEIAHS